MEWPSVLLAVLLLGLSGTLGVIALRAGRRYADLRIDMVGGGFLVLALVGLLALLNAISPLYGALFDVDPVPLLLLVVASGLLYASMVRGRTPRSPTPS